MANIVIPGLPNLPSFADFVTDIPVLTKDLIPNPFQSGQPDWGVYLDGQRALVFDAFLSIDLRKGWAIADYPIEKGSFESYNKVSLPFDARVKFASGGSEENRQALLDQVDAMSKTLLLYDIVTPEAVYKSVNIQHYDYRRTATNGVGLITVEIWFLEVRVSANSSYVTGSADATNGVSTNVGSAETFKNGAPPLTNTFDPSGYSALSIGAVQAGLPTQQQISPYRVPLF
jgi:hypothetical protein